MKKFAGLAVGLFSVLSWANPMCVELCTPCQDKTGDETCEKVESLCNCAAVMDSVAKANEASIAEAEAAKAAAEEAAAKKAEAMANGKKQLTLNLLEGCGGKVCERTLYFKDEVFEKSELGTTGSENTEDESIDKMKLLESAESLSDIASTICANTSDECIAKLAYEGATMKLVSLQKVEKTNDEAQKEEPAKVATTTAPAQDLTESPKPKTAKGKTERNWRMGFSLNYGMGDEVDFWRVEGLSSKNADDDESPKPFSFDAGLGFIFRWYVTPFLSLQTGLNLFFYYSYLYCHNLREVQVVYTNNWGSSNTMRAGIDVEAGSWNISSELPLTIRLGIPLGSVQPYASFTHTFRKPYTGSAWMEIDGYQSYNKVGDYEATYGPSDWEFEGWIGGGLDINRFVSAEFQWMLYSAVIPGERGHKNENYWRTSLQFVW